VDKVQAALVRLMARTLLSIHEDLIIVRRLLDPEGPLAGSVYREALALLQAQSAAEVAEADDEESDMAIIH